MSIPINLRPTLIAALPVVPLPIIEIREKGLSIDILVEISALFKVSLDYIIMGRGSQDDLKQLLYSVIQSLSKLSKKLQAAPMWPVTGPTGT